MLTLIRKLHRIRLLSFPGIWNLLRAALETGINLMALLRIAAKLHSQKLALVDEREELTYAELWDQAERFAKALHTEHGIQRGMKVAIICRNHAAAVKATFAVSRLGAHLYFLNPDMSSEQIRQLNDRWNFDFYIYDPHQEDVFRQEPFSRKSLVTYHPEAISVDALARRETADVKLKKAKAGNIVVLTGGTTGQPKSASRKPSVFAFLPPFLALLCRVELDTYRNVYIATPIYHGFGLAALFIGVVLGTEMHFTERFDADQASQMIAKKKIEAVTVVPLMLMRMLKQNPDRLSSLRCIVTGGAVLGQNVAEESLAKLGPTLFNLYGTSEAGFCIMATPESLARKPTSIGKPIPGVKSKIVGVEDQIVETGKIGGLWIASSWAVSRKKWIETGDLAYRDADGDLFLCGRADDMIVSGGENVYPVELENVLLEHPQIESAAVIGIPDQEFGQRLKAVIIKKNGAELNEPVLLDWLKERIARHQIPAKTEFRSELPYTRLGKIDKKALKAEAE